MQGFPEDRGIGTELKYDKDIHGPITPERIKTCYYGTLFIHKFLDQNKVCSSR